MAEYLKKNQQTAVADLLQKVLGTSFALYMKTHAYHWNVEGPHFHALHEMFEEQYTELWNALDTIAERMRAVGAYAPYNAAEMMKASDIKPASKQIDAIAMVKELADDNAALSKLLADSIEKVTEMGDESTGDLFVERQRVHDLNAWMLNATAK